MVEVIGCRFGDQEVVQVRRHGVSSELQSRPIKPSTTIEQSPYLYLSRAGGNQALGLYTGNDSRAGCKRISIHRNDGRLANITAPKLTDRLSLG